jgi:hypothetical protein
MALLLLESSSSNLLLESGTTDRLLLETADAGSGVDPTPFLRVYRIDARRTYGK